MSYLHRIETAVGFAPIRTLVERAVAQGWAGYRADAVTFVDFRAAKNVARTRATRAARIASGLTARGTRRIQN